MGRKSHQEEEQDLLKQLSLCFPGFMDGMKFAQVKSDPPDFLGIDGNGHHVGLELTSWLDGKQVGSTERRERMRADLLRITDWRKYQRPLNFSSVVILPHWGKKIRASHSEGLCREFHTAIQEIDRNRDVLKKQHWRGLATGERFDFEAYNFHLKEYPILCEYVSSIWFSGAPASIAPPENSSWISVIPDGGIYDPATTILALRMVIEKKVQRYNAPSMREHLAKHRLDKLYLLVYADRDRFGNNTPFQTGSQMNVSPVEGLPEAASIAVEGLNSVPTVFDGIFLFYPIWNAQWLAQIWPIMQQF
jgi:hypothetical protein